MESGVQLGVMLWCADLSELRRKAELAAAAGFRYCQATLLWAMTAGEASVAEEDAVRAGVEIVAFGVYVNLLRPDDELFSGARMETAHGLATAMGSLRCRRMVTWSGSYGRRADDVDPANWTPEAREAAIAEAQGLATRLRIHGACLCVEPYHAHVLRTPADCASFVEAVDREMVRVVLDPPNLVAPDEVDRLPERLPEMVRDLAPITGLVHLKDVARKPDGSVEQTAPGRGTMDYARLCALLREHEIRVPAIVEGVDDASVPDMETARVFVEGCLQQAGIPLL